MSVENKWKEEKIGEQLKLLSGFPFSSNKFSTQDGFPLIRIRDVVNSTIETYYLGDVLTMYIIKEGDVLIGMDGDFHIDKWKNRDALLNQRVLKVEVDNPAKLDSEFIFYLLQPYLEKVNEMTAATTVKHLSTNDLRKAKAKIPCLAAQQKIGSVLNTIDRTIAKTEALIEKYQQIKAGLMRDLFTRGIGADGKLRSRREEAPELYRETAIGWIPKEWKVKLLDYGLSTSPKNGFSPQEADIWQGIYVLGLGCLTKNGFSPLQLKKAPKNALLSGAKLENGDFLISRSNTQVLVGLCGIYRDVGYDAIYPDLMMKLKPNQNLTAEFLEKYLLSEATRQRISAIAVGTSSSMVKINATNLRSLKVTYPKPNEQIKIVEKLKPIEKQISCLKTQFDKLQKQKSGLMHDLLTGKVSVNVDSDAP